MSSFIEMANVKKTYRMGVVDVPVLRGIDVKIEKGESVAVLGKSGSGKTTLLNLIGLLDEPTEGRFMFNDVDVGKLTSYQKTNLRLRKIGFVFQFFNLLPELNVLENVKLPMIMAGASDKKSTARAVELLEHIGLAERMNNMPFQISGGEMQRIAIARAIANNPELVLADEPTGNLDSKNGQMVMELLKSLHEQGHTIIMVTHDQQLANMMGRIIYVSDGKVVERI